MKIEGRDHLWRSVALRFRLPLAIVAVGMVFGTIGYGVIEGWGLLDAFYMTVITLTTVGFKEVAPLSNAGRVFTIGVMLYGGVIVLAAAGSVAQLIISGELGEPLRRRRMQRRIDALSDHFIICAYGRVGRATADEFRGQGLPFVVIERLDSLVPLMQSHDVPFISGDPTQETILQQAGILRAKGLVCAVDNDAINVYITLTARSLNPTLSIVARASDPESEDQLQRAGADRVISPYQLSGKRMASIALQPSIVDFFDMVTVAPDLRLEEIFVGSGSPLEHLTVGECAARAEPVTILAVKKVGGDLVPTPGDDVALAAGDLVVALGPVRVLSELSRRA